MIVLSNNESHADFIADGLSAIVLDKAFLLPHLHSEMTGGIISPKYTGKYMMQLTRPPYMATFPVEFVNRNETLYIHSTFGPDIKLKQESKKDFYFGNGTDQQIKFDTGNNGEILRVWHIVWGVKKELKKIE